MRRIGLFGGTFNPIHLGHLRVAEEAREALNLAQVVFIPAADPPHKEREGIAPFADRLAMVRLAVAEHPGFAVSDCEAERDAPSYSLYTIRRFREEAGGESDIFFIIGADAFAEITTWHRWEEVLAETTFVLMTRPGHEVKNPADALPAAQAVRYRDCGEGRFVRDGGGGVIFLPVSRLEISASDLRRRVREGRSAHFLTPPAVLRYLAEHRLYQS